MLKTSDLAPDFTLPTPNGKKLSLSGNLKASAPLLLVFYKFNCPTCQFTFQYLPKIAQKTGSTHFLAVAQDTPAQGKEFADKYKVHFDLVCDDKPYPVSRQYGFDFVPAMFVVEADGKISAETTGFDKKFIEAFAKRIGQVEAFEPTDQVPLLKPG